MAFDKAGNLYGSTAFGGPSKNCNNGCGTVFKLTHPAAGKTAWTATTLFAFNDADGSLPAGRLILDAAGNLYGTTQTGGKLGYGTVFRLTPPVAGKTAWTQTVLFAFSNTNGADPRAGLVADKAGNLYGTTSYGGNVNACPATTGLGAGCGVVFALTPPAKGKTAWTETTVFSLNATMGNNPLAGLTLDAKGNLYGTTFGTAAGKGSTVFELTPPAAGKTAWKETVLASFKGTNGSFADGTLIFDKAGSLYGVTGGGGSTTCRGGCGTVFKLTPPAAGKTVWAETLLYKFVATAGDTNPPFPQGSLLFDKAGNLYGETESGGADFSGAVFKLTP